MITYVLVNICRVQYEKKSIATYALQDFVMNQHKNDRKKEVIVFISILISKIKRICAAK